MKQCFRFLAKKNLCCFLMLKTILLAPLVGLGQEKADQLDKVLEFASSSTPGAVVAISEHGKIIYHQAVGLADLENGIKMELNSVFDIGSSRKQFIAAGILLLVSEKKLSLTDDIRIYFPELTNYGVEITIDHLLTHTSGIRDWTGLQGMASDDPDAMKMIMRQRGLNFSPGEEWSYSNSGYVLLAEIISKVSGMQLGEFLSKRIFVPLGMKSTSYVMNLRNVIPGRSMAYRKSGNGFEKDMLLDNDRGGAGALFSTASDLVIWNDALLTAKLGNFVSEKLSEPTKLNNGRVLNYGRGLVLEDNLLWHSGSAAGYHSWSGRVLKDSLSIAVLCNSDLAAATSIANKILKIYVPNAKLQKVNDGPPPVLTGESLIDAKKYSGIYTAENGELLRLAVDNDRFRIVGGPGLKEVSKNEFKRWGSNVFFMSQDEFTLEFISDKELSLRTMEGKIINYVKADAYLPSDSALAEFSGKFESPELAAVLEISVLDGMLVGKTNGIGNDITLKPIFKDSFQVAGVIVRFIRDSSGKVVKLVYSNPVVKNIVFTKK